MNMRLSIFVFVYLKIVSAVVALEPHSSGSSIFKWDATQIERRVFSSATSVEVEYGFRSISSDPVTILEVKTSCGCTVSELEKRTYAPGESGIIKVIFNPGNKQGKSFVSIDVTTDAGKEPMRLKLAIEVVKHMHFPRRLILWKRPSDSLVTRYLDIYFEGCGDVEKVIAACDDPAFDVTIESTTEPLEWKLCITPVSEHLSSASQFSRINITAKTKNAGMLESTVYAKVN